GLNSPLCEDLMEQDPSRKEVWKTKAIGFWERAMAKTSALQAK
ncbi:unnamed protein product, partial [marine sediment metagenome]